MRREAVENSLARLGKNHTANAFWKFRRGDVKWAAI
jgi:hypothetical protein